MTAVLKMNIQDLDTQFVEDLKHQFASSEVEIRVHEQPIMRLMLTLNDFWRLLNN